MMYTYEVNTPIIYDTTLRDGEQTPGLAFTPEEKRTLARLLSDLGCHIIDVGFPAASDDDADALQVILNDQRDGRIRANIELLVMSRAYPPDIDRTLTLFQERGISPGRVTLLLFTSATDSHLHAKSSGRAEHPRSHNLHQLIEAIRYARSVGFEHIEFGAEDAGRADLDYLLTLIGAAVKAGAQRYIFADTVGALCPKDVVQYAQAIRKTFPTLPIVSHFHNDLGLATINALEAYRNGMYIISGTLNGIGERAGNTALHQIAIALKLLDKVDIEGFQYDHLYSICRQASFVTGFAISPHEPLIGQHAFAHESGVHVASVLKDPDTYELINPASIGASRRIVLGKNSGRNSIQHILGRYIYPSPSQSNTSGIIKRLLGKVKSRHLNLIQTRSALKRTFVEHAYAHYDTLLDETTKELHKSAHTLGG